MVKYELVPCSINYDHYISVSSVYSLVRDENFVRIRAGTYMYLTTWFVVEIMFFKILNLKKKLYFCIILICILELIFKNKKN
jgi:hypothetical protein